MSLSLRLPRIHHTLRSLSNESENLSATSLSLFASHFHTPTHSHSQSPLSSLPQWTSSNNRYFTSYSTFNNYHSNYRHPYSHSHSHTSSSFSPSSKTPRSLHLSLSVSISLFPLTFSSLPSLSSSSPFSSNDKDTLSDQRKSFSSVASSSPSPSSSPSSASESPEEQVVIIGSGAAGLTAAIYASRAMLSPLVISGSQPGGQLTITSDVENFPGFPHAVEGPKLMENMKIQAGRFGTKFMENAVTKVNILSNPKEITLSDGQIIRTKSIIISTGAVANWIGCEGEKDFQGRGVSSCATCDGFFFKGKVIAVVGGGDSAMEEATFLTRFAKQVVVIHRRDTLRASAAMQKKAKENPKISFIWNSEIKEICGDKGKGKVNKIILTNLKEKKDSELPIEGVFVAIGHTPNSELFRGQLPMDSKGYLHRNSYDTSTSVSGVFVAGDVSDSKYRQAITAAGMGCQAAIDAQHYIETIKGQKQ